MRLIARLLALAVSFAIAAPAGPLVSGASARREAVARAGVLGSALMIGAHPDDENSLTLAWLARGRMVRTAYLSITRGEGGQNLIGPEQGAMLGVIRTQELLAAREIDGAEQFFTRAIDFGFSKSAEETLAKWGHEETLADVVWVIRSFRPDVIIAIFSGTARDGHGHHQAAGILAREAFAAAADPKRFPEQLKYVQPWQAKRLVWNAYSGASSADYRLETGEWNATLGYTYGELAGLSRSMHSSQGMGTPPRRAASDVRLMHVAGERGKDLFDGIDTTWGRVPGGAAIQPLIKEALRSLDDEHPERALPPLLAAREKAAVLNDPWAQYKRKEIDETIALCAGLWLDASAERWDVTPGSSVRINATAVKRAPVDVQLLSTAIHWGRSVQTAAEPAALETGQPVTRGFLQKVAATEPYSGPYWLAQPPKGESYTVQAPQLIGAPETPPVATARFRLRVAGGEIEIERPVIHRYVDRSRGELTRPVVVVPVVALKLDSSALVFSSAQPRRVRVIVDSNAPASGDVRLEAPAGWKIEPARQRFEARQAGMEMPLTFEVTPPANHGRAVLRAVAECGGREISTAMDVVSYSHFPPQAVLRPAAIDAVRVDVQVLAKRIGYVMGAGDNVPEALAQLGLDVRLLGPDDLTGDLSGYDAIVTGVRAYNVRADLRANQHRLIDYVERGGTLVVQYNVLDPRTDPSQLSDLGPFPLRTGRDRVSVEEAPVSFTDAASPLLAAPNRITAADFDGWVQERGLYFASEWDPRYRTLFSCSDPGEPARAGGTLYTKYGRGAYVFTAYSWFRQLPAGVPGAFRIFANLLSAGKTLQ
ncbi:MAG: PIG-L family deacetylase [bacterium]|jgi:LmbE family N-acetylglucosaminyl deacetylase